MKIAKIKLFYLFITVLTMFACLTLTESLAYSKNTQPYKQDSFIHTITNNNYITFSLDDVIFTSQFFGGDDDDKPWLRSHIGCAIGPKWRIQCAPPKASDNADLMPWD